MILDSIDQIKEVDQFNMYDQIFGLPEQLKKAWEVANTFPLPEYKPVSQIVIAGMGGSAIGGDLLASYISDLASVPVVVHRDYDLPAWANGTHTLVIASSHSGNTEETLSAYAKAKENGCQILCISTGGKLAQYAQADKKPLWKFDHKGQPRAAVGYSFGILLAFVSRMGIVSDQNDIVLQTVQSMTEVQKDYGMEIPTPKNPAKRMAGQMQNRWVAVFACGRMSPIARRWKGQISEIAKAWAQFEFLPEANHNTLAGLVNPEELIPTTMAIFLRSEFDHQRNQLRTELTRKSFMVEGFGTDMIDAKGEQPLAQMFNTLLYGDYIAFYLAMLYKADPTPVEMIENFKKEMK
ncbi:MAG: bifunctional phosphoglucose/phosphomannose isomerase [Anaerolineaceae bacterium]|nr:bifunctional phosphoglucose/phosphomannose isomerase [Anaerolineaceae bacterium]